MMFKYLATIAFLICLSAYAAEARLPESIPQLQQTVNSELKRTQFSQPVQPLDPQRQLGLIIAIGLAGGLTWLRSQAKYST